MSEFSEKVFEFLTDNKSDEAKKTSEELLSDLINQDLIFLRSFIEYYNNLEKAILLLNDNGCDKRVVHALSNPENWLTKDINNNSKG